MTVLHAVRTLTTVVAWDAIEEKVRDRYRLLAAAMLESPPPGFKRT